MDHDQNKILVDSIKRLLRRKAMPNLRKIVSKTHAADLSIVFRSLSVSDQLKLFNMLDDMTKKGILLSELDEDTYLDLVTRGLLWACGKLGEDGKPLPGYGAE